MRFRRRRSFRRGRVRRRVFSRGRRSRVRGQKIGYRM